MSTFRDVPISRRHNMLRSIPISRKFIFAFGIVCGLCVLLGAYTVATFRGIAQNSAEVSGKHLPSMILIGDIRNDVNVERRETLELMLCQTPSCASRHSEKRQKAISDYQESLREIAPTIIAEEREAYEKFVGSIKQYQDASDRGVALLAAGKTGDALDLLSSDAMAGWLNEALTATDLQEICDTAKAAGVKATLLIEDVGKHDFPVSAYPAVGQWLYGAVKEGLNPAGVQR